MQRYKINHLTHYTFSSRVSLLAHTLRVRPREGHELRIESSRLRISPNAQINWYRDAEENSVARATFSDKCEVLKIESEIIIQQYDTEPLNFLVAEHAVNYPFSYKPEDEIVLAPYRLIPTQNSRETTGDGRQDGALKGNSCNDDSYRANSFQDEAVQGQPLLDEWIRQLWIPGEKLQSFALLQRLNQRLCESLCQRVREEEGVQSAEETLSLKTGSCRDFAELFIVIARYLGFAARFASGYLYTESSSNQPGATHAWAEVFLPGAGWKGFDPTSGEITGAHHITVAVARLPESVPPVAGSYVGRPGAIMDVKVFIDALAS